MSNPKVSVISALYKKSEYLHIFLEKAVDQTYLADLEFIIDHNEPNEDDIKIIKDIQNNHILNINHIITPKVVPLGVSWNKCIMESKGEYCAIWNFDDLRCPHSIESQVRRFNCDEKLDAVGGDYTIVRRFPCFEGELIKHDQFREIDFKRDYLLGPFLMFKKNICQQIGMFDEQLRCANDFDFALRIALNGKVGMVNSNLGYFLDEGKGASTKSNSLCPVEATVIRLRYGVYDRIDYRLLKQALKYNIYNIKKGDNWISLDSLIKNYSDILEERFNLWFEKGIRANYFSKKLDRMNRIRSLIGRIIHP
ncbi:hypothetical protein DSECCO2_404780 [anaerobic digester metagenome]